MTTVGNIGYRGVQITIGRRWAHGKVRVVPIGGLVHIYYGEELVRILALDQSVRLAPIGKGVRRSGSVT